MRFEEYLHFNEETEALHPLPRVPKLLKKFENLILYGPSGSGKYTLALRILATYSKTKLKYEKRVNVATSTGGEVLVKVSDVHYEVDAELLGCNARTNFYEVFAHITEMIDAKFPNNDGVVLCTNFHLVHPELLEIFYSFMQPGIKFILLTEAVSFLPASLMKRCRTVAVPKPGAADVGERLSVKLGPNAKWSNLKDVRLLGAKAPSKTAGEVFAEELVVRCSPPLRIGDTREDLYKVMMVNQNVDDVFWELTKRVLPKVQPSRMEKLTREIVYCMQCHSCNYRPIFHLEFLVCSLFTATFSDSTLHEACASDEKGKKRRDGLKRGKVGA
jgi:hypothetical protein